MLEPGFAFSRNMLTLSIRQAVPADSLAIVSVQCHRGQKTSSATHEANDVASWDSRVDSE